MTTLVVGATGATGRLLVEQLLERGESVRAVVRSRAKLVERVGAHELLAITEASLLDLSDVELVRLVQGCRSVASCLGHPLSFKGIYGSPRRLVTDSVRRLCAAVKAASEPAPTRFVLMNTAGNGNRDLREPVSLGQRVVIGLLRALLPPHVDNEQAADFLRVVIGPRDPRIEWVAVRPDTLIDAGSITAYDVHPSPTQSAIFNPGKTSRINVAHFMAELISDDTVWTRWKGQMPVVYNRDSSLLMAHENILLALAVQHQDSATTPPRHL